MKKWCCWQSHTCYVCTGGGKRKPGLHARLTSKSEMTSPCDTIVVEVQACNRYDALRTAFPGLFLVHHTIPCVKGGETT